MAAGSPRIQGEGVAASTCAHLLRQAGIGASVEKTGRPSLPAIMIGASTQRLMKDVMDLPNLFAGLPEIRHRVVLWGDSAKAITLPHSAVVASEVTLLDRMRPPDAASGPRDSPWTIFASRPLPPGADEHHFGSRFASAAQVTLKPNGAHDACWVESVPQGWLFLLPGAASGGFLLSVGASPDALLGESRLIADRIAAIDATIGQFPAHPRLVDPLCDPSAAWLACGTAALGFDPLCGDGAGNATREAILASAVVKAVLLEGANPQAVADHYRTRLLAGFKRHLEVCQQFYRTGGSGSWWDGEGDAVRKGLVWLADRLPDPPVFRYRLNGFTLERL